VLPPDRSPKESGYQLSSIPLTDRLLIGSFAVVSILVVLGLYSSALQVETLQAPLLLAMLVVSLWHIIENDLELARAYRSGMQLGAIGFDRSTISWIVGGLLLVIGIGLSTPSGVQLSAFLFGRPLLPPAATMLDDFIIFIVFYHSVSWIVFLLDRARVREVRAPGEYARVVRRLLWLHLGPSAPLVVLFVWFQPIYLTVAAPGLYLFFSVLHTLHTGSIRGFTRAHAAA
jgi:hypothetical protein